jgi:hypothetical protein
MGSNAAAGAAAGPAAADGARPDLRAASTDGGGAALPSDPRVGPLTGAAEADPAAPAATLGGGVWLGTADFALAAAFPLGTGRPPVAFAGVDRVGAVALTATPSRAVASASAVAGFARAGALAARAEDFGAGPAPTLGRAWDVSVEPFASFFFARLSFASFLATGPPKRCPTMLRRRGALNYHRRCALVKAV